MAILPLITLAQVALAGSHSPSKIVVESVSTEMFIERDKAIDASFALTDKILAENYGVPTYCREAELVRADEIKIFISSVFYPRQDKNEMFQGRVQFYYKCYIGR